MWSILGLSAVIIALITLYVRNTYRHWKNKGVPTPTFNYIFGNSYETTILTKSPSYIAHEFYESFKGNNYVGFYSYMQPSLLVLNAETARMVLLKEFNSFHDNTIEADENYDVIFGKNPFVLNGERWKVTRGQAAQCFTSSKVKAMFPLMLESSEKMLKYLNELTFQAEGLNAKELASRYTIENVASCAFGLNGGAFTETEENPSEFVKIGRRLSNPSMVTNIKFLMVFAVPALSKIIKTKFFDDVVVAKLREIVGSTVAYRKKNAIVRNDFLDFMIELKSKINDEKKFNDDDILAHAGGFFFDGFETSAVSIGNALYEIAAHSEVQEKLRDEIRDAIERSDGKITADGLQSMEYLDCVYKESQRLHPPIPQLMKRCTSDFKLPAMKENGTGASPIIEKGTPVVIPLHSLQRDPRYFQDPERFDPDRFNRENAAGINKFAYAPFGEGPRMCVGMRFGVTQSLLFLATIIANFRVTVNGKTREPLTIDPAGFLNTPLGGIWLDFEKLN